MKKAKEDLKRQITILLVVMISISAIIFVISSFVELDKRFIYNNFLTLSISLLSVITLSILIKTIRNKNQPTNVLEFLSLLIAMIFWFAGEVSYSYLQIVEGEDLPFPGPPEIFFFTGYFFLIYYLYQNFKFWSRNRTIKKSYVIFSFSLTVFLISIILFITIQEELNEIDIFLTDLAYYILDGIILFPAIAILLSVLKRDPISTHQILISLFIVSAVSGDFGYLYLATTTDEEIAAKYEWVWVMLYSFDYLFVAFAGLWYTKIITISHGHINRVIEDNKNRFQSLWQLANDRENENSVYESENKSYEDKDEKLQYFNNDNEIIKYLGKEIKSVNELAILYSSQDTKSKDVSQRLFQLLIKLFNYNKDTKTRILLKNKINDDFDHLFNTFKNNPNIEIRPSNNSSLKNQLSSFMIIMLDKNRFFNITTDNNTKFNCIFSADKQKTDFHNQLFEVNWLLSNVR